MDVDFVCILDLDILDEDQKVHVGDKKMSSGSNSSHNLSNFFL